MLKPAAGVIFGLVLSSVAIFTAPAVAQQESAGSGLPPGFAEVESRYGVDETVSRIEQAVEEAEGASVVETVNHAQNAQSAGLDLRPTQVILFGNPELGTPLMQANQLAGLDLPQKMLVYEDAQGQTHVAYNTTDYLTARHGLSGVETLGKISDTLANLASNTAGASPQEIATGGVGGIEPGEGVVKVPSNYGVDETFSRLQSAIEQQEGVSAVTTLDHQQNAAGVGMDLRPTRLLVAGNPQLGTPLMQSAQTTGIDLPQKFLVYEDAQGETFVAYNDPYYIAGRHGITGADQQLQKAAAALEGFASEATGSKPRMPETGGPSLPAIVGTTLAGAALMVVGGLLYRRSLG